ncbi:MAG: hypothetical protein F4X71_04790 [Cenarchaeum sp. SB0662_bin_33]|nr:hypothetical protein [Cenarchaeum sp. SB0662_bin_33]
MTIKKFIHIDEPAQPSKPGLIHGAKIKIKNQRQIFLEGNKQPTQSLKMVIHEPRLLGLKNSDQLNLHDFFNRVITTCNLLLKNTRLSTDPTDTAPVEVCQSKQPPDIEQVQSMDDGVIFPASDTLKVRGRTEIELHSYEDLDEAHVCKVLDMLHAVYDAKDPPATVGNIRESLKAYSRGIVARDREEVFKGLFVALEKAVNFDKDRSGKCFDSKVKGLCGNQNLKIGDIRKANGRLKHPSSEGQFSKHPDNSTIYEYIKILRPVTVKIMLDKLEEVARQIKNMS